MSNSLFASIGTGNLGRVVVARVKPGQDLYDSLVGAARHADIRSGVILSCVAFLDHAVLRNVRRLPDEMPITDEHRIYVEMDGPFEVDAVAGYIRQQNGETTVHAHIVISGGPDHTSAYGGHLIRGCRVFNLAEIVIAEITGLDLVADADDLTHAPALWVRPTARTD